MVLPQSRTTTPKDSFDTRFRGMCLPVVKRPRGYFQTVYSQDLIRSSIMSILATRKGERVFVPEFGTRLHGILFQPNDAVTRGLVKQAVTEDVALWEKRVRVENVRLLSNDHTIQVYVSYEIISNATLDSVVISFSRRTLSATVSPQ